jgi:hypothetical protein
VTDHWTGSVMIALAACALLVTGVWYAAIRIDRMHRRVDRTRATLQLQLARRASVALDIAHSGLWDPVTSIVVAEAARSAIEAEGLGPEESELTVALRAALGDQEQLVEDLNGDDPVKADALRELADAWYRVELARRFHNEAVSMTRRLRQRRTVRWFWLAGRTPMPVSCDIDDAPPAGLELAQPLA